MSSLIDQYRALAAICAATRYDSEESVARHNEAVTEMRRIVAEPGSADELLPLLQESLTARWLAFPILELSTPDPFVREMCLSIIHRMAAGSDVGALGAKLWLKENLK